MELNYATLPPRTEYLLHMVDFNKIPMNSHCHAPLQPSELFQSLLEPKTFQQALQSHSITQMYRKNFSLISSFPLKTITEMSQNTQFPAIKNFTANFSFEENFHFSLISLRHEAICLENELLRTKPNKLL